MGLILRGLSQHLVVNVTNIGDDDSAVNCENEKWSLMLLKPKAVLLR